MSLDRDALDAAIAAHGPVARVVVADHAGSTPREAGAAMLVWVGGQSGTIGGGALEWHAAQTARAMLDGAHDAGQARVDRIPLGPAMGQCCGGAVTLVTEVWTASKVAALPATGLVLRPVSPDAALIPPLPLARMAARQRNGAGLPAIRLSGGWLAEPLTHPARALWIWGAGHVGRALVATISPLPGFALTWADTDRRRFPDTLPPGIAAHWQPDVAALTRKAPPDAEHLILTYSHALDLDLCHRLLGHGFRACGLIGSATKWARFRSRLSALGHSPAQIARIACPIGNPALGKHPQAIAVGVTAALLGDRLAFAPHDAAATARHGDATG